MTLCVCARVRVVVASGVILVIVIIIVYCCCRIVGCCLLVCLRVRLIVCLSGFCGRCGCARGCVRACCALASTGFPLVFGGWPGGWVGWLSDGQVGGQARV